MLFSSCFSATGTLSRLLSTFAWYFYAFLVEFYSQCDLAVHAWNPYICKDIQNDCMYFDNCMYLASTAQFKIDYFMCTSASQGIADWWRTHQKLILTISWSNQARNLFTREEIILWEKMVSAWTLDGVLWCLKPLLFIFQRAIELQLKS